MNAALEEVALVLISAAFELVTCRVFAGDFSRTETFSVAGLFSMLERCVMLVAGQ